MAFWRRGRVKEATGERTLAQRFCLLGGLALLLAGLFGFIASTDFDTATPTGAELQGDTFIVFEVNGWHNVVHLVSGLVLVAAANTALTARVIAIGAGVAYLFIVVIGVIDGDDVLGFFPVNGADHLLHLALALLGIAAGLASPTFRGEGPRLLRRRRAAAAGEQGQVTPEGRARAR